MEMIAGLIPIKEQVNKLMKKACLRVCTLHSGYPVRAYLGPQWAVNKHNIDAPL
jgi:hypothetical protein